MKNGTKRTNTPKEIVLKYSTGDFDCVFLKHIWMSVIDKSFLFSLVWFFLYASLYAIVFIFYLTVDSVIFVVIYLYGFGKPWFFVDI